MLKGLIFIAEDNRLLMRLYVRAFLRSGFRVETAFDGEEAIKKLDGLVEKPVAAVLDVLMPKLSGLDVLRNIREDARLKNMPVIILTNLTGYKTEGETALSLGAAAYLNKNNCGIRELIETAEHAIYKNAG